MLRVARGQRAATARADSARRTREVARPGYRNERAVTSDHRVSVALEPEKHDDDEQSQWSGVFPAITTPFAPMARWTTTRSPRTSLWLVDSGCARHRHRRLARRSGDALVRREGRINETCVRALDGRVPVVAGIAGLATAECVALARAAERAGCDGLMALPAYVYYSDDWRETRAHFSAIIAATPLSCMLYNNPIAYRTDVRAEQLAELADAHDNLHAVKESSGDVRRVSAVRAVLGDRLAVFAGLDDMILEAIGVGADGVDRRPGERAAGGISARSSSWRAPAGGTKRRRSITGSCRCCGWTPCRSSCS